MGILAELLAEVEEVKMLRARSEGYKKEADYWYDRACYSRIKAKAWKKLAKNLLWRKNAAEAARDLARQDRSFAENRNEVLSTELDEAHKLIDTLLTQCKDDYEDIEELRAQRNGSDEAFEREHNKNHALLLEVSRLFSENEERRGKCTE